MIIEISTDQLAGDISAMQSRVEALENAKTQVYQCLDNLNGMWIGPAHEAFVQQTEVDSQELIALIQNIQNLISCMEYAKREYDECQGSVNDMIAAFYISGG